MKKIYSLVLSALMLLPSMAFAQSMTQENAVLSGEKMNYRLEKDVNFVGGVVNEGMSNEVQISPNDALAFGPEDTSIKINNYYMNSLTNTGLEFMKVCSATGGIDMPAGKGLRSIKNERWIGVSNLRKGQILAFDISNQDEASFVVNSIACNGKTNWADNLSDPLIVESISQERFTNCRNWQRKAQLTLTAITRSSILAHSTLSSMVSLPTICIECRYGQAMTRKRL